MARFDGKTVLITGGTSGIGLATAKRIADEGGKVGVTGHSPDHLDDARRILPEGSMVVQNDAAAPDAGTELARAVDEQMGKLDGLFLNAGYGKFWPVTDSDAETFDHIMNTNVRGPVLHMAALKGMLNDGGAVLVTSSVAPYLGQAEGAVYGATKAACYALARAWSADLAPRNIRVNSVAPGPIDTDFLSRMDMSDEDQKGFEAQVTDAVPLGRMGISEEVAAVACFLLSDESSYVSGSEYFVDGGMTKR